MIRGDMIVDELFYIGQFGRCQINRAVENKLSQLKGIFYLPIILVAGTA